MVESQRLRMCFYFLASEGGWIPPFRLWEISLPVGAGRANIVDGFLHIILANSAGMRLVF